MAEPSRPQDSDTYDVYVQQKIDAGLAAAERGEFISDEEIEQQIASWVGEKVDGAPDE